MSMTFLRVSYDSLDVVTDGLWRHHLLASITSKSHDELARFQGEIVMLVRGGWRKETRYSHANMLHRHGYTLHHMIELFTIIVSFINNIRNMNIQKL